MFVSLVFSYLPAVKQAGCFFFGQCKKERVIKIEKLRTKLKQIPYRGYRLARNDTYELVADWPAFF